MPAICIAFFELRQFECKSGCWNGCNQKNGKVCALIEAKGLCQVLGAGDIGYIGSDSIYHFFQKWDKFETHKKGEILFAVSKPSLKINFEFDYDADIEKKIRLISKLEGAEFICNKTKK